MAHSKLYRSFIILQEDERCHTGNKDKPLSGYTKIEVKNDKCKITYYVQNVKKDSGECHMALICNKKDVKKIIDLGPMNINEQGKMEVTCEYPINDIAGLGISYDKICGAALFKDLDGKVMHLMAGFMTGEVPKDDWKNYKMIASKNKAKTQSYEKAKPKCKCMDAEDSKKKESKDKKDENKNKEHKCEKEIEIDINVKAKEKQDTKKREENEFDKYENEIDEARKSDETTECNEVKESSEGDNNSSEEIESKVRAEINEEQTREEVVDEKIKEDDTREVEEEYRLTGSIGEFFSDIILDFEDVSYRHKKVDHCKWYKVPVMNLDTMCNVSNYKKYTTLYYPMINYYPYIKKYGHFMIGLKGDKEGLVKYIVYAIPGLKNSSEQPYGGKSGFVTWMKDVESREGLGYWLMFYDFKNSMVVVPMK